MSGMQQTREEYFSDISDGSLRYYTIGIADPIIEVDQVYLELGVGYNTLGIIKYPFWQMTNDNPKAVYACLNYNEAFCPKQIEKKSICLEGDAGVILDLIQ